MAHSIISYIAILTVTSVSSSIFGQYITVKGYNLALSPTESGTQRNVANEQVIKEDPEIHMNAVSMFCVFDACYVGKSVLCVV